MPAWFWTEQSKTRCLAHAERTATYRRTRTTGHVRLGLFAPRTIRTCRTYVLASGDREPVGSSLWQAEETRYVVHECLNRTPLCKEEKKKKL